MAGFFILSGLPGGGKSYAAAEIILKVLKEGGKVHTQMPLEWEKLEAQFPGQLVKLPPEPSSWVRIGDKTKGEPRVVSDIITGGVEGGQENLVVIDEAALDFDVDEQGEKSAKERNKPIFRLIALTRHVGLDIYFISQDAANVNVKLRRMCKLRINCVNSHHQPGIGWILAWFGDFYRVAFKRTGGDQERQVGPVSWHRFNQEIADAYKTHGEASSIAMNISPTRRGAANEDAKRGRWKVLALAALAIGALAWGIHRTYSSFNGTIEAGKEAEAKLAEKITAHPAPMPAGSRTIEAGLEAPASHRQGLQAVEWLPEDEWIIAARWWKAGAQVLTVRGGLRLAVGWDYMGELIEQVIVFRGWYYYTTETGRVVVARPHHPAERERWRQEYIAQMRGGEPSQPPPAPFEAVKDVLKQELQ